jgi:hypothetical protein
VVEIVSISTVEQASETQGGAVAVPKFLTQESSEGKPLPRMLRCEWKQENHVRKVTLSLRERTGDVPVGTLDSDLIGCSAPSKGGDVTTRKLVVSGPNGSEIGA